MRFNEDGRDLELGLALALSLVSTLAGLYSGGAWLGTRVRVRVRVRVELGWVLALSGTGRVKVTVEVRGKV